MKWTTSINDFDRVDVDAIDDRGFAGVVDGNEESLDLAAAGRDGGGERAADGADGAIEREFADHDDVVEGRLFKPP